MTAGIQYELLDTSIYQATATGGMVEITEVSDNYVGGTFEFTAHSINVPPGSNAPSDFTIAQGQFYARLSANGQDVVWDGVQ